MLARAALVMPLGIYLHPVKSGLELGALYARAFSKGKEVYLLTAFLTAWDAKAVLSRDCRRATFVLGLDFGLTRRSALTALRNWLPAGHRKGLFAFMGDATFHPKILLWKEAQGGAHLLLGSSNMTRAAMDRNYEANLHVRLSQAEFATVTEWIESILRNCKCVTPKLIAEYCERAYRPHEGRPRLPVGAALPTGLKGALKERRAHKRAFAAIAPELLDLIRKCANGTLLNEKFYEQMRPLWSENGRFQGPGVERLGKNSDWQRVCRALADIVAHPKDDVAALDTFVAEQIDELASRSPVVTRKAWLSEMLCHYLPQLYPVLNRPVREWSKRNGFASSRGNTEGEKYIDLAVFLREKQQQDAKRVRDLAELDHLIWAHEQRRVG